MADPEAQFEEWDKAAQAILPPLGSVFENVAGNQDGPPMMRIIIMQMAFGALSKASKVTKMKKVGVIIFISLGLMSRDLSNFFKSR